MAKKWDVFICHASEDKDSIVRPLADALRRRKLKVWYDEFVLMPGQSLRKSIDEGLAKSTCGVIVLSQYFFGKTWPERELGGLFSKEPGRLIPVWHEISSRQVKEYSHMLADIVAINSRDGIGAIAEKVRGVVRAGVEKMLRQNQEILDGELVRWGQAKSPGDYNILARSFVERVNDLLNERRRLLLQELGEELTDDPLGTIYPYVVTSKSVLYIAPGFIDIQNKIKVEEGQFCDACGGFRLNCQEVERVRASLCPDCAIEYQAVWRVKYSRITPNVLGYVRWKQKRKDLSEE